MNPKAIPFAMLEVSGMLTITRNAGKASSKSFQSISDILLIIKLPTMIKLGAVIAGTEDTALTSGLKNAVIKNKTTTVTPVNPVFPPVPSQRKIQQMRQSDLFRTWLQ
ncbi:hypothetical protein SAMN05428981_11147 [Bacillus sp. OV194]|nr:hypothetical protein SAMN05428981_11147 [Bacillus sp. OV194]